MKKIIFAGIWLTLSFTVFGGNNIENKSKENNQSKEINQSKEVKKMEQFI